MTIEHHNLINEFPEYKDKIHDLKMNNRHFQHLSHDYHELDKKIRQSEVEANVVCDETLEDYKKQRLHLKDELLKLLQA